uniref:Uncharacterized protein n=1 Tax=Rhizophora mucronata TaxID=61149 RepID=A0A2P2JFJ5_RHIMU
MLAFASPMLAHAIAPPLITISGFAPKKDGFHRTRSAHFPTSTEPTNSANPFTIAGFIVYFAMYRLIRKLSLSDPLGLTGPLCDFILWAVCQVLLMTSPMRPIA